MSSELFFPIATYIPKLAQRSAYSLMELCEMAGAPCRATGQWVSRSIEVKYGDIASVHAEPGDWGAVTIVAPCKSKPCGSKKSLARYALMVLAYSLHDLVARESVRGQSWASLKPPRGRPKTGRALTVAERQQRFRERQE